MNTNIFSRTSALHHLIVLTIAFSGMVVANISHAARPASPHDGQIHDTGSLVEVWDARASAWVEPETFWIRYAKQASGTYWGRSADYPAYRDADEHDTILIETEHGSCLMYFFHSRWRRAQDVRRWDAAFNDVGGCPRVFD